MSHIPGTPLLGFGDFFAESDLIGAKKATAKAPSSKAAKAPAGKKYTLKEVPQKKGKHKKPNAAKLALTGNINAGKRALAAAQSAAQKVASYRGNVKAGKHSPVLPVAVTKVHGDGCVTIGAAVPARVLTPKQKAAVETHNKAIAAHHAAAKKAAKAAAKAQRKAKKAIAFAKKNAQFLKGRMSGKIKPKTAVGMVADTFVGLMPDHIVGAMARMVDGFDMSPPEAAEIIGEAIDIIDEHGAEGAAEIFGVLFQSEIGSNIEINGEFEIGVVAYREEIGEGEDDAPAAEGGDAPAGEGAAPAGEGGEGGAGEGEEPEPAGPVVVKGPDGKVLYDSTKDPDVVPVPVRGKDLSKDEAMFQWDKVPDGGIVCPSTPDGSKNEIGSWKLMYDKPYILNKQGTGYLFGDGNKWYGIGIGTHINATKATLLTLFAPFGGLYAVQSSREANGPGVPAEVEGATDQSISKASRGGGCGPLVGDPKGRLKNLQYAQEDDKWFWLPDNAPAWATQDIDAKIAESNKQTISANAAAARAIAAQMEKDIAEKKEAEAKAKAERELAEKAAESKAKVAETERKTKEAALATEQKGEEEKLKVEQARAEIEIAKQQAAVEAAAGRALVEQAQAWNEYAKKHPEAAAKAMQQQGEGEGEGEGEGGEGGEGGDEGGAAESVGWGGPVFNEVVFDTVGLDPSLEFTDQIEDFNTEL